MEDRPPSTADRLAFYVIAIGPWLVLYFFTAALHLPGRPFQFAFEDRLPIYPWTSPVYQSIYVVAALAPWVARTRRDLRRLTLSLWISMAVVFPFYWLMPSQAPRRALQATNWISRMLLWERGAVPPTEAFPSFHMLWAIFLARLIRPAWLGAVYAVLIGVSCITTGMHYIPDLLASLVLAPAILLAVRKLMKE